MTGNVPEVCIGRELDGSTWLGRHVNEIDLGSWKHTKLKEPEWLEIMKKQNEDKANHDKVTDGDHGWIILKEARQWRFLSAII